MSALPVFTVAVRDGFGREHAVEIMANGVRAAAEAAVAHLKWRAAPKGGGDRGGPYQVLGIIMQAGGRHAGV